jgi:isoleucyl-tRNA synthetase
MMQTEPGYGADVLRLWVSSVDYTGDVMIGPQILRQMSEIYRKLRGTLRYLLSNLHDWKVETSTNFQIQLLFTACPQSFAAFYFAAHLCCT